ncbi:MAG: acyl-CoA dehydrogenase, partial [Bacteroidota bacterium]
MSNNMRSKAAQKGNRVLEEGFRTSENFYDSDRILYEYLAYELSKPSRAYMTPKLERLGEQAAVEMDELSLLADQKGPELVKRDRFGETIDEVRFHPAYDRLMEIAVESEMMRVKWEPELRNKFEYERHRLGFAAGYLFAMGESGQYCPLCMTDGVALLLDRFSEKEDRDRLLPPIYAEKVADFFTGAMFLTEKAGGSDVGANLVE